jgi:acetoin utilization protein AcuB
MMPSQKPVSRYMSAVPIAIQQTATLSEAIALLQEHGVRHLPVLDGESAVGIVSERDLAMAGSLVPDAWADISVAEAMTPHPYTVTADTPIHRVARNMAEHRYGAVLVTDAQGKLIGLFTTTDAMLVLAGCGAENQAG